MSKEEIDKYLKSIRRKSDNTKKLREMALQRLDNWSDKQLKDLTEEDVEDWIADAQDDMKNSSINTYLTSIRGYYRWLKSRIEWGVGEEELRKNLKQRQQYDRIIDIENLEVRKRKKEAIELPEMESMLKNAYERSNYQFRFLTLYAYFGLRRDELRLLKTEAVDYHRRMIHVNREITKTKDGVRTIPYSSLLDDIMKSDKGYLIGKYGGENPYNQSTPNSICNQYQSHVTGKLNPKRFRITFDTKMSEAGVDDFVVKRLMGHSTDIDMTEYYRGETEKFREELRVAMTEKHYFLPVLSRIL